MIAELCPDGVKFGTLADIGDVCMCKRIFKEQTETVGDIPFYKIGTFGKEPDAFISKKLFNEYREKYSFPKAGDILISAAGTIGRTVIYNGQPAYFQDSNIVWVDNDESKLLNKFLYYLFSLQPWAISTGGTISRLYNDNIRKTVVPLPPLQIQREIVRILDNFTELTAELTVELTARKKQYNYYRDELLTFGDDVPMVTLGDVYDFQYGTGNTIPTSGGQYPVYGSNGIVGQHSEYNSENSPVIGHIGAYAGIVNWGHGKHFVTYNGVICRLKNYSFSSKFAYYLLLIQDFGSKAKSASHPFVSYETLKEPLVPLIPLEEQARIVAILDRFDILTTDITSGLPAEIAARQKQYEYYRDKLLSFGT